MSCRVRHPAFPSQTRHSPSYIPTRPASMGHDDMAATGMGRDMIPGKTPSPSGDDYVSVISTMSFETAVSGVSGDSGPSTRRGSRTASRQDPYLDESEVLRCLNEFRSQHGAPPLRWSPVCARHAQKRARHEAGSLDEYGENLARSTSLTWRQPSTACIDSIHRWQEQETRYDYEKPGRNSNTDRFTNNVWKLTTHVGFGVSLSKYKGKSTVWVVAYFYPRGNQANDFARNVLPKGTVYDGDDQMVRVAPDVVPESGGRRRNSIPPAFVRVSTVNTEIKALQSANGRFRLEWLPDRDFAIREAGGTVWKSGSRSTRQPPVSGPFRLILQKNGDLVAYDQASRVFWSTDTANCGPPPFTLLVKDDGRCVLFDGRLVARWATSAHPPSKK